METIESNNTNNTYLFDTKVKINLTSLNILERAGINNIDELLQTIKTKDNLRRMRNIWKDDIEKIWRYIKRNSLKEV